MAYYAPAAPHHYMWSPAELGTINQSSVDWFRSELSEEASEHFEDYDIVEFLEGGCSPADAEAEYMELKA